MNFEDELSEAGELGSSSFKTWSGSFAKNMKEHGLDVIRPVLLLIELTNIVLGSDTLQLSRR